MDMLRDAVAKAKNARVLTEASGNVTLEAVRAIAETGVDAISIGRLTHSVRAVDIGMDAVSN
ncbi:MAG: nicotinate-nucleotide diphosphorylase (carboxylating), partial [Alphaproteobacteria bacterium]